MDQSCKNEKRIIISLTSYPARIRHVGAVLSTILAQTKQADEIILWLAEEQFPKKEKNLPKDIRKLIHEGTITLRWCDDLKPHKKYFYAFQEYPEDLVITIDDDVLYPPDMIKSLYDSYLRHPNAVSALRVHLMVYDEKTGILPYNAWILDYREAVGVESMQLFHTGNAGVLYPVHLFKTIMLDQKAIEENCLYADDIWIKLMEIISDIPVVLVNGNSDLKFISKVQDNGLFQYNIAHNDEQMLKSIRWTESRFGEGIIMGKLISAQGETNLLSIGMISEYYSKRIEKMIKNDSEILSSWSFRIGQAITLPGRKLKTGLAKTGIIKNSNREML